MATLSTHLAPSIPSSASQRLIPPLEQGDRLSREEYLARYALMPAEIKAERIEGRVHMPAAAVSAAFHGQPHAHAMTWLGVYEAATPGVAVANDSTIALDLDNDPQPDACLRILPAFGGKAKLDSKGFIQGAPDLIVEITASSLSYDLGTKLEVYRRNGVREYLVHRTYDGEFDWFMLRGDRYIGATAPADGINKSEAFPGLWLHAAALVQGNLAEVLRVLQLGRATPEHQQFVEELKAIDAAKSGAADD